MIEQKSGHYHVVIALSGSHCSYLNITISNSNWTEWSTIQEVIGLNQHNQCFVSLRENSCQLFAGY